MAVSVPQPSVCPRANSAADALADLKSGELRVGMTFGQWSVIDVVRSALDTYGGVEELFAFSWRFSRVDTKELIAENRAGRIQRCRFLSSSAFRGMEANEFQSFVHAAGESSVRLAQSHAKGFILDGVPGLGRLVYLTSANFNRNGLSESFEVHAGGAYCDRLWEGLEHAFSLQEAGAWKHDRSAGGKLFRRWIRELRLACPRGSEGESRTEKRRRLHGGSSADENSEFDAGPDEAISLDELVSAMRRTVAERSYPLALRRAGVPLGARSINDLIDAEKNEADT